MATMGTDTTTTVAMPNATKTAEFDYPNDNDDNNRQPLHTNNNGIFFSSDDDKKINHTFYENMTSTNNNEDTNHSFDDTTSIEESESNIVPDDSYDIDVDETNNVDDDEEDSTNNNNTSKEEEHPTPATNDNASAPAEEEDGNPVSSGTVSSKHSSKSRSFTNNTTKSGSGNVPSSSSSSSFRQRSSFGVGGSQFTNEKEQRTDSSSFFADSPYYDAFVTEESKSLELVSEVFKDICEQTKAFSESGYGMVDTARSLALSCQLRSSTSNHKKPLNAFIMDGVDYNDAREQENNVVNNIREREKKQEALGPHLTSVFEQIGEILEKIASVQENMCNIVETALGSHIEDITTNQIDILNSLKEDVEKQSKSAETIFFKYINGKDAGGNLADDAPIHIEITSRNRIVPNTATTTAIATNTMDSTSENSHANNSKHNNNNGNNDDGDDLQGALIEIPHDKKYDNDNTTNGNANDDRNGDITDPNSNSISGSIDCKDGETVIAADPLFGETSKSTITGKSTEDLMGNYNRKESISSVVDESNSDIDNEVQEIETQWAQIMENVRMEQAVAEFKRFLLYKFIVDAKHKRTYIVSEGTERFCNGLQNYFSLCTKIVKSATSQVTKNKKQTKKMWSENQKKIKSVWKKSVLKEKEHTLREILRDMRKNTSSPTKAADIITDDNDASESDDLAGSLSASIGRSIGRSMGRSLGRSVGNSGVDQSIGRSGVGHSMGRWSIGQSILSFGWSIRGPASRRPSNVSLHSTSSRSGNNNRVISIKRRILLENTEREVRIWDIPTAVATTLPFSRALPPEVLMEGWLYEKETLPDDDEIGFFSFLHRKPAQQTTTSPVFRWKKRWCMLKYDGIFCLEKSEESSSKTTTNDASSKSNGNNTTNLDFGQENEPEVDNTDEIDGLCITKICEIDLCSIRQLQYDPSERFCFKLVLPSSSSSQSMKSLSHSSAYSEGGHRHVTRADEATDKVNGENSKRSIIFQARGPNELAMWVNGIRSASLGGYFSINNQSSFQLLNDFSGRSGSSRRRAKQNL